MDVEVTAARFLTPVIREFTLAGSLPAFSAGSHVVVEVPAGGRSLRNAYSLAGDPLRRDEYRIAVRLDEAGRGGSRALHELRAGTRLSISPPANLFPVVAKAAHHILVAGGIGITPFMAYIEELERRGASYELHYAFRPGLSDAFLDTLRERLGARLHAYGGDGRGGRLDPERLLAGRALGSHVYACGPTPLLDAVRDAAARAGWPGRQVHFEAFAAPEPGEPFTAVVASTGQRIPVAAEVSLLEALEEAGVAVPSLCRGGVCGECRLAVREGRPLHRDHYLNEEEKRSGTRIMPCVSRCQSDTLVLDL